MRFSIELGRSRGEPRSSLENPSVSLGNADAWASLLGQWNSVAGPKVTVDSALGIPAFWCAVNFLSGMIASLPLHEFKRTHGGRERVTSGMIPGMLGGTVNDDFLTSFKWRRGVMTSILTTGASRTFIEKNKAGQPINLWPLGRTTKHLQGGRTLYKSGGKTYAAHEVIDLTWLDKGDGVSHFDPIARHKDSIGLVIAMERYAAKFFQNGGVPPLALHAPVGSPAAAGRAKSDVNQAIRKANEDRSDVVIMPAGTELKPIGLEPEKGQLVEAQRFGIEQVARIFNLPPVFLQDLTHGTFSNTEQQDLHLVKHVAATWVSAIEQELNAKFYGLRHGAKYVEFNLDGLLRGDFKTRMEGWARGVQGGVVMPNEARRAENRPDAPGGDRLYIQGATVPLEKAGDQPAPTAPPAPPVAEPTEDSDNVEA